MFIKFKRFRFANEYFLFLLPLFFILHRYVEHLEAIKPGDAFFLYFRYVLWTIAIFIAFYLLFKDSKKAFIYSFFLSAFYLFFGSIHDFIRKIFPGTFIVHYSFIIPFVLVVFIFGFILLKRSSRQFNRLTRYLNFLFIILIAIDLFQLAAKTNSLKRSLPDSIVICDSCKKPDIYLIVADGYGGRQQLTEYFKFDNSEFENYLRSKGFYIVDSSISNYPFTVHSMSSMFNWEYLGKIKGYESHEIMNRTNLFDFLKRSGYSIKIFSVFKIDDQFPPIKSRYFPTGTQLITCNTFFSRLVFDIGHNLATKFHIKSEIDRIEKFKKSQFNYEVNKDKYISNALKKAIVSKDSQPKFVYSHFTMPHAPYLFDSKGRIIPGGSGKEKDYLEYLQYTNSQIKEVIDNIFASYSDPPIIYFMSDHGYRETSAGHLNPLWFSNINAVYFPDKNYSGLYKGMSNVNQFRVLLNKQFKQNLPMQKDSVVHLDLKQMGLIK